MGKNKMVTKVDKKTGEHVLTKHGRALKNKIDQKELNKSLLAKKLAFTIQIKATISDFLENNPFMAHSNVAVVIPKEAITLFADETISFSAEDEISKEVIKEITDKIIQTNSEIAEVDLSTDKNTKTLIGDFKLYATQTYKHKFPTVKNPYGEVIVTSKQFLLGEINAD